MNNYLLLALITLIPTLELRASIPYGILGLGMGWLEVFVVCVVVNAILGLIIYFLLDKVVHLFLHIKWIDKIYTRYVTKTQKKIHKYVEKYGEMGVAAFIAIPLPGSGSYSGALAAYLLGLGYRKFAIANLIGVVIAGVLVTAVVMLGDTVGLFSIFAKTL